MHNRYFQQGEIVQITRATIHGVVKEMFAVLHLFTTIEEDGERFYVLKLLNEQCKVVQITWRLIHIESTGWCLVYNDEGFSVYAIEYPRNSNVVTR